MGKERVFPFGATYAPFWRARAVGEEEWDADLQKMKDLGFTCVNIFAAWQRIERQEGLFDFHEVDHIVDTAERLGLLVSTKIGVHRSFSLYPPRWLMRGYRGTGMLDRTGHPAVTGLACLPCFDDPVYREQAGRYIDALVSRYAGSETMRHWIVWGEASIDGLCYCAHTRQRFQQWLRERHGSLGALNAAWGTETPSDYETWEEIQPPTTHSLFGGYSPWLDWQEFLDDDLAAAVAWVRDRVRLNAPRHPTMTEIFPGLGNSSGNGSDIWKMVRTADQLGLSIFRREPWEYSANMDLMRSVVEAHGKEAWAVELQGGPTHFSWCGITRPSPKQVALWPWQMIAHGAKGFIYWTFRPRLSDVEGGDFGLLQKDGELTDRARLAGAAGRAIQSHAELLLDGQLHAEVALFGSRSVEHLASIEQQDGQGDQWYAPSVRTAYRYLWEESIPADFVSPEAVALGRLPRYKVLVMAFAECVDRPTADKVKDFVRGGGTVIADFPCAYKDDRGVCHRSVPGAGLDELFGATAFDSGPAGSATIMVDPRSWRELGDSPLELPAQVFLQPLKLGHASPLGRLAGGEAAIAVNHFGRGTAILAGTLLFPSKATDGDCPQKGFLLRLLAAAGVRPPARFAAADGVQVPGVEISVLHHGEERAVVVMNHGVAPVSGILWCRGKAEPEVVELLTGIRGTAEPDGDGVRLPVTLEGEGCALFRLRVSPE